MKRLILYSILVLCSVISSQSQELKLIIEPENVKPGDKIRVTHQQTDKTFSISLDIFLDDVKTDMLEQNKSNYLILTVPANAKEGRLKITIEDIIREEKSSGFILVSKSNFEDTDGTNGHDPDPNTQYGDKRNVGIDPKGKKTGKDVRNPSGGNNNVPFVSCEFHHVIDGVFTDSVYGGKKEWSDITPLLGRFSNLYMDYCNNNKIMYLLNDWYLGTAKYDSNSCYNKFELITGGGSERWEIWVYHSIAKGIKVIRNGVVVAENDVIDTNFVVGGKAGFGSSLLYAEEHTIYEFAIKVKSGVFYLPAEHDPYRPPSGGTGVTVICNDEGYGLVKEPLFFTGTFDDFGTTYRYHERYIPEGGVAGLEKEPNTFLGFLTSDSCKGPHKVDGAITKLDSGYIEWSDSKPAIGKYSNLYADYCDGNLYILNDWKLADSEPDQKNCYNLFELFTAGGKQHWGIFVYHDPHKPIKVFLNGLDVSSDTTIVKAGAYGFNESILLEETHTIYEFSIKADEGNWLLYLCDPGPSSFCDESDEAAPRKTNYDIIAGSKTDGIQVNYNNEIRANYIDTIIVSIATNDQIDTWFARKLKLTINYDKFLTFPVISKFSNNLKFDSINYKIITDGKIEIEGFSDTLLKGTGELFELKFLSLAGNDSISNLNGTLEIGNSSQYMYLANIKNIKICTKSDCPLTNNLITLSTLKQLVPFPNPVYESNQVSISFNSSIEQLINIRLYNSIGNEVKLISKYYSRKGDNYITLEDLNCDNGIYFITVDNSMEFLRNSLIIMK